MNLLWSLERKVNELSQMRHRLLRRFAISHETGDVAPKLNSGFVILGEELLQGPGNYTLQQYNATHDVIKVMRLEYHS